MEIKIEIVGDDTDYSASLMKVLRDAIHEYGSVNTEALNRVGIIAALNVSLDLHEMHATEIHVQIDRGAHAAEVSAIKDRVRQTFESIERGVRTSDHRLKL